MGHGLWTAILGGVLFATWRQQHRFSATARLIAAYLGVSALHALWDSMHGIALTLTLLITEGEQYQRTPNGWLVQPTSEQVRLLPMLEWSGLAVISVVGVAWLTVMWRRTRRR